MLAVGLLHCSQGSLFYTNICMYIACVRAGSVTYHRYRANMTAFRIYPFSGLCSSPLVVLEPCVVGCFRRSTWIVLFFYIGSGLRIVYVELCSCAPLPSWGDSTLFDRHAGLGTFHQGSSGLTQTGSRRGCFLSIPQTTD